MPYGGFSTKELAASLTINRGSTSRVWKAHLTTLAMAWLADPRKTVNALLDEIDRNSGQRGLDGFHLPIRAPLWKEGEIAELFGLSSSNAAQKWQASLRRALQVGTTDFAGLLRAIVERAMELEREQAGFSHHPVG